MTVLLWTTPLDLQAHAPVSVISLRASPRTLPYCPRTTKPWITTHMMLCCTIFSDRYATTRLTFRLFCVSFRFCFADARRRMVQAVRRERSRRRLPSYPNRPIPRVPLREPPLGAVRGGSPCPEPRSCCQGTQRGCPRGVEHGVSQGVPGSPMEVYYIVILTDAALFLFSFSFLSSRNDDATAIYVDDDTRIQILDSMSDLPRADKEQCGAFIVSQHSPIMSWATTYNILPSPPPPKPETHVLSH